MSLYEDVRLLAGLFVGDLRRGDLPPHIADVDWRRVLCAAFTSLQDGNAIVLDQFRARVVPHGFVHGDLPTRRYALLLDEPHAVGTLDVWAEGCVAEHVEPSLVSVHVADDGRARHASVLLRERELAR